MGRRNAHIFFKHSNDMNQILKIKWKTIYKEILSNKTDDKRHHISVSKQISQKKSYNYLRIILIDSCSNETIDFERSFNIN